MVAETPDLGNLYRVGTVRLSRVEITGGSALPPANGASPLNWDVVAQKTRDPNPRPRRFRGQGRQTSWDDFM